MHHGCPDSVYFNTLLLIIYLSAIETLICRREMSLIGSTSFGFAQNTIHDFQNTVLNSKWHCLRQMPQKLCSLTLPLLLTTQEAFVDSSDQDQTAQNVQSDL